MQTITLVGGNTGGSDSNTTTPTVTWPAGIQAGDYAVIKITTNSISAPGSNPTGFGAPLATALSASNNSSTPSARVYGMFCTGSESGSLTVPTPSTNSKIRLEVWRGVDPTDPLDIAAVVRSVNATLIYDLTVAPTMAGTLATIVGAENGSTAAWSSSTSGYTETLDDASPTPSTAMAYLTLSSSGSQTINFRSNLSARGCAIAVVLRPAPDPGGAYTGTLDATLPKVIGSISATSTVPAFAATLDATLPKVTGSIAATSTLPAYAATLDATLPKVTGSIAATSTAPTFSATLDATLPELSGSIDATSTTPVYTGSVDAVLPELAGSTTGTSTVPTFAASLDGTLPQLTGSIDATSTTPVYTGSLDATLPSVAGSIDATSTAPTYVATLDATLPILAGAIDAESTRPAGSATLSAELPRLTSSIDAASTTPTYAATLDAVLPELSGSIDATSAGVTDFIASLNALFPQVIGSLPGVWIPAPGEDVNVTVHGITEHVRSVSIVEHVRSVDIAEHVRDVGIMERTRVVVIEEG